MDVFPCCEQLHTLCPVPLDFCNRVVDTKKAAHRAPSSKTACSIFPPICTRNCVRGACARMRAAQPQQYRDNPHGAYESQEGGGHDGQ